MTVLPVWLLLAPLAADPGGKVIVVVAEDEDKARRMASIHDRDHDWALWQDEAMTSVTQVALDHAHVITGHRY